MQALSVKELRTKFPLIRKELEKGESFLLIYKSKPIGQILPVNDLSNLPEATDEEWEQAALQDLDDGDYLTKEELDYYLSLPPLKK